MLTRLLPDQISKFWPIIKYAIEESLPPIAHEHPDKMNRVLASALGGATDVWASYTRGEENRFEGIVLTRLSYDETSNTKSLLIYCLYGYEEIDKGSWSQGLELLAKYAKLRGCSRIIAYTSEPYIIKLAKGLGANIDYTFISFDLNKIV